MKKAFTLVELMGVIVILGVMSSIVTVTVNKNIQKGNITTCLAQEKTIIEAAKTRQVDKPNDNSKKITISTLKSEGYLDDTLENPMTGKPYNDNTYVSNSKGTYELVYVGEKDCTNTMGKTEEEILASLPVIKSWTSSASTDFHDKKYKENITSIEFIDLNDDNVTLPADAPNNTTSWDVSEKGNQSVIAWVTADPQDNDKYVLHIAAKDGVFANKNSSYMFDNFINLRTINFGDNFDTSNVTSMQRMFSGSPKLESLDLKSFDTSKVKSMYFMFYNNKGLKNINFGSNFDTGNVTGMSGMFWHCESLTTLNLGRKFDTSKVTSMDYMFEDCYNLENINLGNKFDTGNVTSMISMFDNCQKLKSLDLSTWDTSNVTKMNFMFADCHSLTSLDVSNFDTSEVTNMSGLFGSHQAGSNLGLAVSKIVGIENLDTSKTTDMSWMFVGAHNLQSLDLSKWDTSNVKSMKFMFYGNKNLKNLNIKNFDTSKVTNMSSIFEYCESLTTIEFGNKFDTSNVTSMESMFEDCTSLTSLDVSKFNTSKVTNMSGLFARCKGLTTLDLSKWDTSNVTNMGPQEIPATETQARHWSGTTGMFNECSNLTTIYASDKFDTSGVIQSSLMFYNCVSLVGGNGTTFNSTKTDKEYARIDKVGQPGYFTQKS